MRKKGSYLKSISTVCLTVMIVGTLAFPTEAASLMDARLNASFWPIISDSANAYTFYGTNTYAKTAKAYVKLKGYKSDGVYKTKSCTRYGWDAVSGEGDAGSCYASVSFCGMTKAVSTHKGKKKSSSKKWSETVTKTKKN